MTSNQTLVLDINQTPSNNPNLSTFTCNCCCQSLTPVSDYVVTTQHGAVSVIHKVVEIVRKTVAAVKAVARKAGTKIRSTLNGIKAKALGGVAGVKSGLRKAYSFTASKAAAVTVAVLIGASVAKNFVRNKWNRTKTICVNLYVSAKAKGYAFYVAVRTRSVIAGRWCARKAIQFGNRTKTQWDALCLFVQRCWVVAKPRCVRIGKVVLVAVALYLIATAGLLVCCVIVAALSVHVFERMQQIVIVRNNTNQPVEQQQKSFPLKA